MSLRTLSTTLGRVSGTCRAAAPSFSLQRLSYSTPASSVPPVAESSASSSTTTKKEESAPTSGTSTTTGRLSPRAIRLKRAAERRLLPQVSHLTQFPDLSKPDPLLDAKSVIHVPASAKHPYSATVIEYSPYFGASLQKDLPDTSATSSTSPSEQTKTASQVERDEREAKLPYPPSFIRSLHRYPLILKRVVNQTPKGRIASFYALVVVGNGNGVMGIGEGKDKESTIGAQSKAYAEAIKSLDAVSRFEDRTIFSETRIKLGATQIKMWPRPAGFGLAVNPYIHQICKAAGISDLSAKVIGSRNGMQVSKATMMMLHGGAAPTGFGNGVGGKGRRLDAKAGIRTQEMVERERGRKLIEGSGWV